MTDHPYYVLAYYLFAPIENPKREIKEHKRFFEGRDVASRIYISEDGINGQMSAAKEDAIAYMEWMRERSPFQKMPFKIHGWHENVFPRVTVKNRNQLVAIDREVDMALGGEHVSPKEWKEMLEKEDDKILIDVRNDYEWKVGHFEGSELPKCETFREFEQYAEDLKARIPDKANKPIMMCCTGGIRCELYSAVLKEKGFEKVYQLDGGIINYGLKEGSAHWKGKLFVFDDRLTIPISDEEAPVIGQCHHCGAPSENYYNCANMDCNTLFLCCEECLKEVAGCCCNSCKESPRIRPYHEQNPHKPFRRKSAYATA